MKRLWYRLRFWFLDKFGVRTSVKYYTGHGNFDEVLGWTFHGRFYECKPGYDICGNADD